MGDPPRARPPAPGGGGYLSAPDPFGRALSTDPGRLGTLRADATPGTPEMPGILRPGAAPGGERMPEAATGREGGTTPKRGGCRPGAALTADAGVGTGAGAGAGAGGDATGELDTVDAGGPGGGATAAGRATGVGDASGWEAASGASETSR